MTNQQEFNYAVGEVMDLIVDLEISDKEAIRVLKQAIAELK